MLNETKKPTVDLIKLIIESGYPARSKVSDKDIIDKPVLEDLLKAKMLTIVESKKVLFK